LKALAAVWRPPLALFMSARAAVRCRADRRGIRLGYADAFRSRGRRGRDEPHRGRTASAAAPRPSPGARLKPRAGILAAVDRNRASAS